MISLRLILNSPRPQLTPLQPQVTYLVRWHRPSSLGGLHPLSPYPSQIVTVTLVHLSLKLNRGAPKDTPVVFRVWNIFFPTSTTYSKHSFLLIANSHLTSGFLVQSRLTKTKAIYHQQSIQTTLHLQGETFIFEINSVYILVLKDICWLWYTQMIRRSKAYDLVKRNKTFLRD